MAHILLAEDDENFRKSISHLLALDGHDVWEAEDGGEALAAFKLANKPEVNAPFDLVLADIAMPVMDGISFALHVAGERPALPVILMTGYRESFNHAQSLEGLIAGVLTKPFAVESLRDAVNAALAADEPA